MDIYKEESIQLASKEILKNGDRLHGEDLQHIEFAVGLALAELQELYSTKKKTIATLIELGVDDTGPFISFVPA